MALDSPTLDDVRYDGLLEDLRKRIPVHSDVWTDHNAHDPGVTLVELFAWLAETYGYQLDQVTDEHRRAFLGLLGERPRPPVSASARLVVDPASETADRLAPAAVGTTIETGTRLAADDGTGRQKGFETTAPLVLTGATIASVVSTYRSGRGNNTTANDTDGLAFQAFGPEAEPRSAIHLGFDADPFASGADVLDLDLSLAADVPSPVEHGGEPSTFEPSVCVEWQYLADGDAWFDDDAWRPLPVLTDETVHLHTGGRVRLGQPETDPALDPDPWDVWRSEPRPALGVDEPLRWLRATVVLPDPEVDRPPIPPCGPDGRPVDPAPERTGGGDDRSRLRYDLPPRIERVRVNVLEAHHRTTRTVTVEPDLLEGVDAGNTTTARPNQRFAFPERPVLEATVALVDRATPDNIEVWTPVEHFAAADPDDRVYVLDEEAGFVHFGDNVLGAIPPAGWYVVPTRVVSGGGVAGNVPTDARWTFAEEATGLESTALRPLGPATGGRDGESVAEAFLRVRRDLRTPYRCVSLEDYRQVALRTPGLRFGRATALVDTEPTPEGCAGHDRIRVVVVPYSTVNRPEPSRGFLDAVERHVCEHALLTDRVAVDPPLYVGVGVTVEVRLTPNASERDAVETVRAALDDFLDPLTGYDGDGWPFGRTVYRSEVYEVVDALPSVDCAVDVDLVAADAGGGVNPEGDIDLDPAALVYPLDHEVLVRTDRETCGDGYGGVS